MEDIEQKVFNFITSMCGKLDHDTYSRTAQKIIDALQSAVTDTTDDSFKLSDEDIERIRGLW